MVLLKTVVRLLSVLLGRLRRETGERFSPDGYE